MHEHQEWTDRLSDYLDGELSGQDQRAVAAHVAECAECARTLDELRTVTEQARALAPAAPSADLWRGIADRIASPEGTRPIVGNLADVAGSRLPGPNWSRRVSCWFSFQGGRRCG